MSDVTRIEQAGDVEIGQVAGRDVTTINQQDIGERTANLFERLVDGYQRIEGRLVLMERKARDDQTIMLDGVRGIRSQIAGAMESIEELARADEAIEGAIKELARTDRHWLLWLVILSLSLAVIAAIVAVIVYSLAHSQAAIQIIGGIR